MIGNSIDISRSKFIAECEKGNLMCASGDHPLDNPYLISRCQHIFCRSCLAQGVKTSPSCPTCKINIKADDFDFSSEHNDRLKGIWESTYGNEEDNFYEYNMGQDKDSIVRMMKSSVQVREPLQKKQSNTESTVQRSDWSDKTNNSSEIKDSGSYSGKVVKKVNASGWITLDQCMVEENTKTQGKLIAKTCTFLGNIQARDGVDLTDSNATEVKTAQGKANITGGGCDLVEAREGVTLKNVDVSQHVKSSQGNVIVEGGKVKTIEANEYVSVTGSVVNSITINAVKLRDNSFQARLVLNGDIEGNVKVVVKNDVNRSNNNNNNPRGIVNMGGGSITIGGVAIGNDGTGTAVSAENIVCDNGLKILTKVTYTKNGVRTYYDLDVQGVSYPLSFEDFGIIRKYYGDLECDIFPATMKVEIPDTITKKIRIGNKVFGGDKCVLKITGSGTIRGKVEFVECSGKVDKDDSVTILG
jgi:hypothetical protein